jgi:hypothetical protein
MEEDGGWLSGLRWVDRAERVALIGAPLATLVILLCLAGFADAPLVLAVSISHALLLAAALGALPRRFVFEGAAFCVLSALNFTLFSALGFAQLGLLAGIYLWLGGSAAALAAVAWVSHSRQWGRACAGAGRESYRWLLTRSPLPIRLHVLAQLRRQAAGANSGR